MNNQISIKRSIIFSAFATSLFFIGCAHTPEQKADHIAKKIEHRLDLNANQTSELNKLKDEALADYHGMKAEHENIMDEVQKEMESGKLDREKLKKLAAEERSKRGPVTDKWIDNLVTFHEGLDAKQKDKVLHDMKEFKKEMSKE
jgi:hypothetical protein